MHIAWARRLEGISRFTHAVETVFDRDNVASSVDAFREMCICQNVHNYPDLLVNNYTTLCVYTPQFWHEYGDLERKPVKWSVRVFASPGYHPVFRVAAHRLQRFLATLAALDPSAVVRDGAKVVIRDAEGRCVYTATPIAKDKYCLERSDLPDVPGNAEKLESEL